MPLTASFSLFSLHGNKCLTRLSMTGFEPGPLVSEATTLPTVPQQQPEIKLDLYEAGSDVSLLAV